jgi:hypothetical protein
MSVRVWSRANYLDEDGGYIPVFGHPAQSPAPGPLGPHGSFLLHDHGGSLTPPLPPGFGGQLDTAPLFGGPRRPYCTS